MGGGTKGRCEEDREEEGGEGTISIGRNREGSRTIGRSKGGVVTAVIGGDATDMMNEASALAAGGEARTIGTVVAIESASETETDPTAGRTHPRTATGTGRTPSTTGTTIGEGQTPGPRTGTTTVGHAETTTVTGTVLSVLRTPIPDRTLPALQQTRNAKWAGFDASSKEADPLTNANRALRRKDRRRTRRRDRKVREEERLLVLGCWRGSRTGMATATRPKTVRPLYLLPRRQPTRRQSRRRPRRKPSPSAVSRRG